MVDIEIKMDTLSCTSKINYVGFKNVKFQIILDELLLHRIHIGL
jgi:hypothetical protein